MTGFTAEFTSVASRQVTDPETLRRLLLVLFGLGTNMGIKRVADGAASASGDGGTADSEAALRRVRRLFINRDNLRGAIRRIVNETLAARDVSLWGHGTSCASDSVSTPVASRARGHLVSATAASAAEANNCRRASSAVIHPRCSHSRPASESPAITTSPNGMERKRAIAISADASISTTRHPSSTRRETRARVSR